MVMIPADWYPNFTPAIWSVKGSTAFVSEQNYLNAFFYPFQSLLLMNNLQRGLITSLTFLVTCFKVVFNTSSLPRRLNTSLLATHRFRPTSLFHMWQSTILSIPQLTLNSLPQSKRNRKLHKFLHRSVISSQYFWYVYGCCFPFASSGTMVDFSFEVRSVQSPAWSIMTLKLGICLIIWNNRNVAGTR